MNGRNHRDQTSGCLEITDIREPDGMMDPTFGWYINIYILKLVDQIAWQQLQLHYGELEIIKYSVNFFYLQKYKNKTTTSQIAR